ncbi:hypothetical protein N6H18_12305 [Reichenbachiella agarivorans]|uniref:HPt domain-containing protein n=1 Tax=Reichenbachiella agarivorans TaxID=2979464 RepID=A0ABY6CKS9_9BACT|nr:hypothetical protein [Reichenbachiella agarivorans]UXP31131.1 hypothetical protein N6H18_12305 [Reichenbachiella agarivorans]
MNKADLPLPLDYSYLYEISDDDRDFIKDMLATVVKNTPGNIEEIIAAQTKKSWTEVARLVHKLKPSLLLLNIEMVSTHIRNLESNAKKQTDLDLLKTQIAELKEFCDLIVSEIKKDIEADAY